MAKAIAKRVVHVILFCCGCFPALGGPGDAQPDPDEALAPRVNASVARAAAFLKGRSTSLGTGEDSVVALALAKAAVEASDPALSTLVAQLRLRVADGAYLPARQGGQGVYEAACAIMTLVAVDADAFSQEIKAAAGYLVAKQFPAGCWDYDNRGTGDTSFTQFALLGLWEARQAGVDVPVRVFDEAAGWLIANQEPAGPYAYHPGEGQGFRHSVTAGALMSLVVCAEQLGYYQVFKRSSLLRRKDQAAPQPYTPRHSRKGVEQALAKALAWLELNFTIADPVGGHGLFYLYGLERFCDLSRRDKIGGQLWYEQGVDYLLSKQGRDGSWAGDINQVVSTSVAVLFLTRSMRQSLRRFQGVADLLGGGELVGGRGMPEDLGQAAPVAGAGPFTRATPIEGSTERLLGILRTRAGADAAGAGAGILSNVQREGAGVLDEHLEDLEALARDERPEVRQVALWALARAADYQGAPALIRALRDKDSGVRNAARDGLILLSRKPGGFGLPPEPSREELEQAVAKWQDWYEMITTLSQEK